MTVAPKLDCRAGNATLTTVPSMKAMLVPRMAAARTHGPDSGSQGASSAPKRTAASSHGGFIEDFKDANAMRKVPKPRRLDETFTVGSRLCWERREDVRLRRVPGSA